MTEIDKRNLVAQWAFDTRPVLLRFHLWLEDVEVERAQAEPVSAYTLHAARHRPLPGHDLGGDGARHPAVRRLRPRQRQGQVGAQPGQEVGRRGQRLRDERGALAPDPHAPREPRVDGLPGRGADAQGRGDTGDGRQPDAGLRPRLRPARAGPHRRPSRAAAAQRAGPHLRAVLRVAAGARHHAVGRGRRHAREHLALRGGAAHRPHGGLPPVRLAAPAVQAVRVLHGMPHRSLACGRGGRAGLGAARLPHAAPAGDRGHRGGLPRHPA